MTTSSLSPNAQQMIEQFQSLQIGKKTVSCPYANNKRSKVRAALRVLVGKGSPKEIAEEALLISIRKKIDLEKLDEEQLIKFLVDNNLGIDCSGFAYHVLNAELNNTLKKQLFIPTKSFFRKLIVRMRLVENANVKVFAHEKNSSPVELKNIQAGDMIIMLGTGDKQDLDHLLIVEQVSYAGELPSTISYAHSLWWKADGKYHHGIKHGVIEVKNTNKSLLKQTWSEAGVAPEKNETLWRAQTAEVLEIRRIKI